jgi:hypothetical protein
MAHHPRAASQGQRRLDGILEPAKRACAAYFVQEQTPQLVVVNGMAKILDDGVFVNVELAG